VFHLLSPKRRTRLPTFPDFFFIGDQDERSNGEARQKATNLTWFDLIFAVVLAVKNVLRAPFFLNFRNFGTKRDTKKKARIKFIDLLEI